MVSPSPHNHLSKLDLWPLGNLLQHDAELSLVCVIFFDADDSKLCIWREKDLVFTFT